MLSAHDDYSEKANRNLRDLISEIRRFAANDKDKKAKAEAAIAELIAFLKREKISLKYDNTCSLNRDLLDLITHWLLRDKPLDVYKRQLTDWAGYSREYDQTQKLLNPRANTNAANTNAQQVVSTNKDKNNVIATASAKAAVDNISAKHPKVSKHLERAAKVAKLLPVLYMPASFIKNHTDDFIKLDELMAEKLQDLYASNAYISESQDKDLAVIASQQALEELPDFTEKLSAAAANMERLSDAANIAKVGLLSKSVAIPKVGVSTSPALVAPIVVK